jgi:hypothetical protein
MDHVRQLMRIGQRKHNAYAIKTTGEAALVVAHDSYTHTPLGADGAVFEGCCCNSRRPRPLVFTAGTRFTRTDEFRGIIVLSCT